MNGVIDVLAWVDSAEEREVSVDAILAAEVVFVGIECFSRLNCSAMSKTAGEAWFEVVRISGKLLSDRCLSKVPDIELKNCLTVLSDPGGSRICSD